MPESLHTEISDILVAHGCGYRPVIVDAIIRSVAAHRSEPVGIDQGVSRLALRAFVSGLGLTEWNGSQDDGGSDQWIRYRGHHVSREASDDGWIVEVSYVDHQGRTMVGRYLGGTGADENTRIHVDQDWTAGTLRAIDDLLDDVIAAHGMPDDAPLGDASLMAGDLADGAR